MMDVSGSSDGPSSNRISYRDVICIATRTGPNMHAHSGNTLSEGVEKSD
jgi:hypothetical protein